MALLAELHGESHLQGPEQSGDLASGKFTYLEGHPTEQLMKKTVVTKSSKWAYPISIYVDIHTRNYMYKLVIIPVTKQLLAGVILQVAGKISHLSPYDPIYISL